MLLALGLTPAAPAITSAGANPAQSGLAYTSTQPVDIGGVTVELQAYALVDANNNRTNYVKVRDVAAALDGTAGRFNVGWSGERGIYIEPGVPYNVND